MKISSTYREMTLAVFLLSTVLTGCSYQHGERFYSDDTVRSTGEFAQAQGAAGAKEDGMLYDMNFRGQMLNSLGQGKLDLILKATPMGDPVMVYLSMPHEVVAEREATVAAYLKTAGVPDTKIIVAEGPNMNKNTPTAYNLQHVYRKEGEAFNGEGAKDEAPTGGAMGSPATGH